jgi:hypothetical protein
MVAGQGCFEPAANERRKRRVAMKKEAADLKYPMVDLLTGATISLMYLNVLTASNLMLLSTPWIFMEAWMKGLESGSETRRHFSVQ